MGKNDGVDHYRLWAELRFSIIGHLLSSPPDRGELRLVLKELASKSWRHPMTGELTSFGSSTIERWYYRALKEQNPIDVLRRKVRKDCGQMLVIDDEVKKLIIKQYKDHPSWDFQLHSDNLEVSIGEHTKESKTPSYSSVKRFMKKNGLFRKKKSRNEKRPGAIISFERSLSRETRLFEAEYCHSLWHLDFHDGSRQVIHTDGSRKTPICFAALDDHSRLCCHAQWYFYEDTECLVHGIVQAFQKRGLPRELMTDNGSAMKSAEFTGGLKRIGVTWSPTMEYSPNQNGKQENWWGSLERRVMAMLENVEELNLKLLNDATISWVEMEYNRQVHSETKVSPIERIKTSKNVGRPSPEAEELRDAFTREVQRNQRRSDGTVTIENTRYEVPSRYRTLEKVLLRYSQWDLSSVFIVNPETGKKLVRIYPVDLVKNWEGSRRAIETDIFNKEFETEKKPGEIAPLLKKLMADFSATGLPPPYIPKIDDEDTTS